jgi:hypothetical protein
VPDNCLWSRDQRAALAAALDATKDETPERTEAASQATWHVASPMHPFYIPGGGVTSLSDMEGEHVAVASAVAVIEPVAAMPSHVVHNSDFDSGPSAQSSDGAGASKRRRNRRSKHRRKHHSKTFVKIQSSLHPRSHEDLRPRVKNGTLEQAPREAQNHTDFFNRVPTMITLKQCDPLASLFLLNIELTLAVKPGAITCDTDNDLLTIIAPNIASYRGLTWTPGSAQLFGIGGVATDHSYADDGHHIVMRMGGFDTDNSVGPWEGCHIIYYRPIVMEASVVADIGAEVMLGQRGTLLLALRPAPQVLATIKMEQIANALPQIKEVWGMALKQQLDDYIAKALDHHQLNNGLDEEYYISALLYRAGPKSVIGHVLTTVSRSHEMNGITPLEYFISKAEAARVQWERTYGSKAESAGARQMRAMIDKLDVDSIRHLLRSRRWPISGASSPTRNVKCMPTLSWLRKPSHPSRQKSISLLRITMRPTPLRRWCI